MSVPVNLAWNYRFWVVVHVVADIGLDTALSIHSVALCIDVVRHLAFILCSDNNNISILVEVSLDCPILTIIDLDLCRLLP